MTDKEWVGELASVLQQLLDGGPFAMDRDEAAKRAQATLWNLDDWQRLRRPILAASAHVRRPLPWQHDEAA